MNMRILSPDFYARDTVEVAKDLLGKKIIRQFNGVRLSGIIVETEAYRSDDPACHAYRGKTERNKALFGPVGHSYVYFIYGNHFCLNLVSRDCTKPSGGVLIRALQPVDGIETMMCNRADRPYAQLTNGPGKLAQALGITKADNHHNLSQEGPLFVVESDTEILDPIVAGPRIGISAAQEHPWRFYYPNNPWVSAK
jgi:DNA-3-methyladenine glycosylase